MAIDGFPNFLALNMYEYPSKHTNIELLEQTFLCYPALLVIPKNTKKEGPQKPLSESQGSRALRIAQLLSLSSDSQYFSRRSYKSGGIEIPNLTNFGFGSSPYLGLPLSVLPSLIGITSEQYYHECQGGAKCATVGNGIKLRNSVRAV